MQTPVLLEKEIKEIRESALTNTSDKETWEVQGIVRKFTVSRHQLTGDRSKEFVESLLGEGSDLLFVYEDKPVETTR